MVSQNLAGVGQQLDSSLPTIYSEFKLLRDETGVARSMATPMPLMPHQGASKNVNNYGRVLAYDVPDGADINQAQALNDTTTTWTPGEVAVQVILPGSTMRRIQDPDLESRTARMLNNAYDLKEDSDGCAQFTSFTPILGSAGTVIGVGHLHAALARLRIGNNRANPEPAPEPHFIALHPLQAFVIAGRLIPLTDVPTGTNVYTGTAAGATVAAGRTSMSDDILRRGIGSIGRLIGATVKVDANIAVDASDDASGVALSKEGFVYIPEVEPQYDPDRGDKSMRGAVELNLWGSYAWGLYRAGAFGVELLFDATLPTS